VMTTTITITTRPIRADAAGRGARNLAGRKRLVDPNALDALVDTYEHKVGPRNGARAVARAWIDPAFKARLLDDAIVAIAEIGLAAGPQGEHLRVLENTPTGPTRRAARIWFRIARGR
jgi:nitrile hydratase